MNASTTKRIPTSRFQPLELVRPLEVFGGDFAVEMSTGLTLNPETALRAAIGRSLQTVLRKGGKLAHMLALLDALKGNRRLSRATRDNALRTMGPFSDDFARALDGEVVDTEPLFKSDWDCLAATYGEWSDRDLLGVVISQMVKYDRAHDAGVALASAGDLAGAERLGEAVLGDYFVGWRALCPNGIMRATVLIETSLRVVSAVERVGAPPGASSAGELQIVLSLLDPKSKPLGNWMRQVGAAAGCENTRELSDRLLVKAVRRREAGNKAGRPITYDLLKGWASMRPSMLMTLDGCCDLLKVIPDTVQADAQRRSFALARFLAFLCDLLRSSVTRERITWQEAQEVLCTRYRAILGAALPA